MNKPHYLHTIKESTQDLCEALTEDYRTYTIRSLKHLTSDYSKNRLASIDKKSGKVYKPASWKSPAKGVRYDLSDEINKAYCLNRASWAGGYLYKR